MNPHRRRTCSYLQRRTSGPMRNPQRLEEALAINRLHYNFIKRHSVLRFGKVKRTPAMDVGAATRPLTFREIFSWVSKPQSPRRLPRLRRRAVSPRMQSPNHPHSTHHGSQRVMHPAWF